MKTPLTFLLILAFTTPLNAQVLTSSDITDIVQNVDSINNGQLTTPIAPMCINALIDLNDKVKVNTSALYNKCAVDLCGLPGRSPSVFVSDDSYAKFLNESTNKKINKELPLIEKVIDKNLKTKKSELAQIEKFLKNPQDIYLKLAHADKKNMNMNVFSKYVKTEVIQAKDAKDRIKVSVMPPAWADANFKKALDTFAKNYQLAQIYDKTLMGKLNLNSGEGMEKSSSLSGGALCNTSECAVARGLYFKQPMFTRPLAKFNNELNAPNSRKQAINGCKAGLISAEIQAADEKKTREVYLEALKSIKLNYVSKFSAHSKGLLENYLTTIVTKASPLDTSGQKKANVDAFKVKATKYVSEKGSALKDSEVANIAIDLINNPAEIETSAPAQPCNNYGVSIWDLFLSAKKLETILGNSNMLQGKDHIYISPFVCQHSDHGKQVLAHEIGHALNSFFQYNTVSESSAKNFKDLRACATDQYKTYQSPLVPDLSLPGDTLLTEEDHADLISYMAIGDKNIYSCSFLIPSTTDKTSYTNLDFKNIPLDSHSNSFTRVIFEAINKKINLPPSCQNLIKEVKPEMRFNRCI